MLGFDQSALTVVAALWPTGEDAPVTATWWSWDLQPVVAHRHATSGRRGVRVLGMKQFQRHPDSG